MTSPNPSAIRMRTSRRTDRDAWSANVCTDGSDNANNGVVASLVPDSDPDQLTVICWRDGYVKAGTGPWPQAVSFLKEGNAKAALDLTGGLGHLVADGDTVLTRLHEELPARVRRNASPWRSQQRAAIYLALTGGPLVAGTVKSNVVFARDHVAVSEVYERNRYYSASSNLSKLVCDTNDCRSARVFTCESNSWAEDLRLRLAHPLILRTESFRRGRFPARDLFPLLGRLGKQMSNDPDLADPRLEW